MLFEESQNLTPKQIVEKLDQFIIGQKEAKKAVAIALRNRYRRQKVKTELKEEIVPKNILMIGPTGVGKTEIARRVAKLVNAPFVKVEATKFTEVGYVGRDVESMIRDLLNESLRLVESEKFREVYDQAKNQAEKDILKLLVPWPGSQDKSADENNPFKAFFGGQNEEADDEEGNNFENKQENDIREQRREIKRKRRELKKKLEAGELEEEYVEIDIEEQQSFKDNPLMGQGFEEMGINFQDLFSNLFPKKKTKKRLPIRQAREVLIEQESQKLIDYEQVQKEAIYRAENYGIIFLDEMDKITASADKHGPDVSREGVQRDILPIVEGSTINTRYGRIKTDHIMFIGAGAFHEKKPSDMIPELQGRFPIRVELKSLKKEEFYRILDEPKNALLTQYKVLLETEGIKVEFKEEAITEIAKMAEEVNSQTEDIGARRLHTIMEKLFEEVSFHAPDMKGQKLSIDEEYVRQRLEDLVKKEDLSRFIL
ncbi:ATP-dependent protease ATPase subunit HslU [Natranaerofaba carboxydovora]|uniref:ATP-dependent protease ATPase subunit HslU n=1 Tax=Natranaerofaba carboxydovora TaxID=2742683 RepID=UPI001F12A355|nr:ATP-dependent protease ATPase subunit HslU [Natranaerofaba carboxydovora]UMZ73351.1 ATP-dependent protease ATPase subunit ClpY [Natranaerofaba carboxydovora]